MWKLNLVAVALGSVAFGAVAQPPGGFGPPGGGGGFGGGFGPPGGGGGFGGGGGGRGGGGFGGGMPDPSMIWGFMAGSPDAPSIDLNQRPDIRDRMARQGQPIPPDGILTKDAFVATLQQRLAQGGGFGGGGGRGGRGGFGGPPGGDPGAPAAPDMSNPGGFGGQPGGFGGGGFDPSMIASRIWQRMAGSPDATSVNINEVQGMRERLERMGAPIPADGIVTRDMFTAAFSQQISQGGGFGGRGGGSGGPGGGFGGQPGGFGGNLQQSPSTPGNFAPEEEREERPIALRYGKLPKELPTWFAQLDTDQDGQIGLYEWREAKRPVGEFLALDQNGDGYLTADEWLRQSRANAEPSLASSGDRGNGPPAGMGDRGGFGGGGQRGGGRGGFDGGNGPPAGPAGMGDRGGFGGGGGRGGFGGGEQRGGGRGGR